MIRENSNITVKNIAAWSAITMATIAAFFCTYYYHFSLPLKSILWISWVIVVLTFAYFTTQGKQAFNFAKEAKIELQKVVWPTRQETVQITLIVMVMVAITGMLLWGVDTLMMWVIGKITHLG